MALVMEELEEDLEHRQRLKAALHYAVGKACKQVGEENELTFSREIIAAVTETTFKQCHTLAVDLELFAKHAKRSTVLPDDVKLFCRHSPSLLQHITKHADSLKSAREAQKEKVDAGKKKKNKKVASEESEPLLVEESD